MKNKQSLLLRNKQSLLLRNRKKSLQFSFWQTAALVLGAVLLTFWGMKIGGKAVWSGRSGVLKISSAQLKETLVKKDFVFINVHTPYEGEIERTDAFLEYDKIEQNQDKLPSDKNAKIVLYCKTGRMSEIALKKLIELGYTNISHLAGGMEAWEKAGEKTFNVEELKKAVLPEGGISAPVKWGKIGPTLVSLGVIDLEKFKEAVRPTDEQLKILTEESDQPIVIDQNNSQFVVDVLWALGLAQKSKVYEQGPMGKEYKNEAGNFASTGGWTIGEKEATAYLNKYEIVGLTPKQQGQVFEISQNIYRPCCGNPTSFPDCNHGMAALGLVELMAAQNFSDEEIYRVVLGFNSFWFPQNYLTLAAHFALQGISWDKVDAKEVLKEKFSGGEGAAKISQEIGSLPYLYETGGGGCGV